MKKKTILSAFLAASMIFGVAGDTSAAKIKSDIKVSTAQDTEGRMMDLSVLPSYEYQEKLIYTYNGSQRIYGVAYVPKTDKKVPLVIFSHELTFTHFTGIPYARQLASHGVATYVFDFRGGSVDSASDGKTTEMSVMTEVSDLECVLENAKTWDFVDTDKIVLFGGSQGGFVTSVVANRHQNEIVGEILIYPALIVQDDVHQTFGSLDKVPETYNYKDWLIIGKIYAEDVWDFDIYKEMKNFKKPVLLLHGDSDPIVPTEYIKKAHDTYQNSRFYLLQGGTHGFWDDEHFSIALSYIFNFLKEINIFE